MYKDSNEELRSTLSALVDSELDQGRLKKLGDHIQGDETVRMQLARYHMIGDCMRGEPINKQALTLSTTVSSRLKDEPTILAPTKKQKTRRWVQPVVGTALAASIAGLGIAFGPQLLQQDKAPDAGGMQIVAQPGPVVSPSLVSHKETRWKTLKPEVEPRLNDYLEDHSEHAVQGGVQGVIPYTSFVSYDGQQRK